MDSGAAGAVSLICCGTACRTYRDSCPAISCPVRGPEVRAIAWVGNHPGRGNVDPYPEGTWNLGVVHSDYPWARALCHPLYSLATVNAGAKRGSAGQSSWCFVGAWKSRDLALLVGCTLHVHGQVDIRIFLPRTACPCSVSSALRHDSASRN